MKRAICLSLTLCACAAPSIEETLVSQGHQSNTGIDWRDQVIYQILVDRWQNGDPNNDFNVEPGALSRYHGGDWQGVIDRLDYLEALGVTALWISPVVKNVEEDAGFSSYHGYWAQDPVRPNAHFGDITKLREMVDAAHERGILVILDIVTNHMGQLFFYDINGNGRPDDWISGSGTSHTCVQVCQQDSSIIVDNEQVCLNTNRAPEELQQLGCRCSADENIYCREGVTYFERIIELDPDYDPRGIQGWTSLGFSGPSEIRFMNIPEHNRTRTPRPPPLLDWPEDRPWFDDPSWYNRRGRVYVWWHEGDYSREFVREQETLGDFPGGLKDLDTDNPDTREALIRSFEFWMSVGDFDGLRIDTLKHVDRPDLDINDRGFWGEFTGRMRAHAKTLGKQNFFMFGEAFDGNDELLGAYTMGGQDDRGFFGRVDSVFYFSQKYRGVDAVFKQDQPTRHLECLYRSRVGAPTADDWCQNNGYQEGPMYYTQPHASPEDGGTGLAPTQSLVNFLDNHDLARFLHENADERTLHSALFFLLTWDGIPCIYYGTEQRFFGGNDPRNREDMALGNPAYGYAPFDTNQETFQYVAQLIEMRKALPALRRGQVDVRWATASAPGSADHGIFAFERVEESSALVVLNVSDNQQSRTCDTMGQCMSVSFGPGTVLVDRAPMSDGASFTVAPDGTLDVTVPARGGRVLVPAN